MVRITLLLGQSITKKKKTRKRTTGKMGGKYKKIMTGIVGTNTVAHQPPEG